MQALQPTRTWSPPACAGQGQRGHGRGTGGPGCKDLAPGCLCLAAAEFACWYSPPFFSGAVPGSALRTRSPRRRKTPGLMVLSGMSCVSGAELGPGLKSLAGVPRVMGQLKPSCRLRQAGCACGQEEQEEGQFPEPAGAPPAVLLISGRAALLGQSDPRGRGGQLGSSGFCPPWHTAPSLLQPAATPAWVSLQPCLPLACPGPGWGPQTDPTAWPWCGSGSSQRGSAGSAAMVLPHSRGLAQLGIAFTHRTAWHPAPRAGKGVLGQLSVPAWGGLGPGSQRVVPWLLTRGCCSLPPSLSGCFIYPDP